MSNVITRHKVVSSITISIAIVLASFAAFTFATFPNIGGNLGSIREISSMGVGNGKALLGYGTPKKYFLAFQNTAEARGTGGIIGAYAIVSLHNGGITVERRGPNTDLHSLLKLPIDLGEEFYNLYGNAPAIWMNSNMSPHFPNGAKIWLKLWKLQTGQDLDGVISVDPEAISYVLGILGPVTLPGGEVISAANVVSKTLSEAYERFAKDNTARKRYLVEIMSAVLSKLSGTGTLTKMKIANALLSPYRQHRLLIYSTDPKLEAAISKTDFGGVLSATAKNEFRVMVLNTSGNKMDYYLRQQVQIFTASCGKVRRTQVRATFTNGYSGDKPLPDYVWGRLDLKKPHGDGSYGFNVFIYGPSNADIFTVQIAREFDGLLGTSTERNRPVAIIKLDLAPEKSDTVTAVFSGGSGPVTYYQQPTVLTPDVQITDRCHNG